MKLFFSDQRIIEALKSSDQDIMNQAFRYLYQNHYPMARQFVRNNHGDEHDAEDVFQDVLIGLYQNVRKGSFRGDSAIKTYLYSMVRNQWMVRLKRNNRNINMETSENVSNSIRLSSTADPADELRQMVESLLSQVGEKCRELLKMYYFDSYSMNEIAALAHFDNENSAKTQKYKCMQKLIRIMAEKPDLKNVIYELLAESA